MDCLVGDDYMIQLETLNIQTTALKDSNFQRTNNSFQVSCWGLSVVYL